MKAVCYILTVYFLSLTGVPCQDNIGHSPESDNQSISVSSADGSHDHNNAGDDCSTLCGCQCCHVHVLMAPPVALSVAESAAADHIDDIHHFTNAVISPSLRPPMA